MRGDEAGVFFSSPLTKFTNTISFTQMLSIGARISPYLCNLLSRIKNDFSTLFYQDI